MPSVVETEDAIRGDQWGIGPGLGACPLAVPRPGRVRHRRQGPPDPPAPDAQGPRRRREPGGARRPGRDLRRAHLPQRRRPRCTPTWPAGPDPAPRPQLPLEHPSREPRRPGPHRRPPRRSYRGRPREGRRSSSAPGRASRSSPSAPTPSTASSASTTPSSTSSTGPTSSGSAPHVPPPGTRSEPPTLKGAQAPNRRHDHRSSSCRSPAASRAARWKAPTLRPLFHRARPGQTSRRAFVVRGAAGERH